MRILTIIGARPQFIKASIISNLLKDSKDIEEIIVNTGQHFDSNMSDVFFNELEIPIPKYDLNIHSTSHGDMTGRMIQAIEVVLQLEKPDMVLVYGDTNSTLAGAISASKMHIPIAHVEAGLRSYDKQMPEETNRVLTDYMSTLLFCPTEKSVKNLMKENIKENVFFVGDVMYDLFLKYKNKCKDREIKSVKEHYCLMTIHREENTTEEKLQTILSMIQKVSIKYDLNFIFPIHPRTEKLIKDKKEFDRILFISPVSYLDMLCLEMNSRLIITDSGGVQKEACWSGVNCITLRKSTEWTETVTTGWNVLSELNHYKLSSAIEWAISNKSDRMIPEYGDGKAGKKIINEIKKTIPPEPDEE